MNALHPPPTVRAPLPAPLCFPPLPPSPSAAFIFDSPMLLLLLFVGGMYWMWGSVSTSAISPARPTTPRTSKDRAPSTPPTQVIVPTRQAARQRVVPDWSAVNATDDQSSPSVLSPMTKGPLGLRPFPVLSPPGTLLEFCNGLGLVDIQQNIEVCGTTDLQGLWWPDPRTLGTFSLRKPHRARA